MNKRFLLKIYLYLIKINTLLESATLNVLMFRYICDFRACVTFKTHLHIFMQVHIFENRTSVENCFICEM